ncbi:MAG: FtsW/RodA/SpoVE family cell cycle protein [Desulfotignum sp.]|nr:FtsW/RodA/SpoVE family cell cycle protein [Desulfotignum sp.]
MKKPAVNQWFLAFCLLAVFGFLGIRLVQEAPEAMVLESLEIQPGSDCTVIGYEELAQHPGPRSAESRHLKVCLENGRFKIYNVAQHKKVDVRTSQTDTLLLKYIKLAEGDHINIGESSLVVQHVDHRSITIKDIGTDRAVSWEDGKISVEPLEDIFIDSSFKTKRSRWTKWSKWTFRGFTSQNNYLFLFDIGGNINTHDQWCVKGIPSGTVRIMYKAGSFYFAPGPNNSLVDFSKNGLELDGHEGLGERLIMGRTYYNVRFDEKQMSLTSFVGQDTWSEDEKKPFVAKTRIKQSYKYLEWNGTGLSFRDWLARHPFLIGAVILSVCLIALSVFYHHQSSRNNLDKKPQPLGFKLLSVLSITLTGLLVNAMWWTGNIGIETLLLFQWIAWGSATVLVLMKFGLENLFGKLWVCILFLCGFGTLVLVQLGAGAENLSWFSYAEKHIVFMIFFAVVFQVLILYDEKRLSCLFGDLLVRDHRVSKWLPFIRNLPLIRRFRFKHLRRILVFLAIMVLLLQFFFGGETGLWGFQPAEGAKLLFVLLGAFQGLQLVELRRYNSILYQKQPFRYLSVIIGIFGMFFVALLGALVAVGDFSPIFIMVLLSFLWLWKIAPHPWKRNWTRVLWRSIILVVMAVIVFTGYLFYSHPEKYPDGFNQKDRFLVWAFPEKYPHSGAQVLKSMRLVGMGGWTGAEPSWFGKNQAIYSLPAVQDDFIAGFILYKFGGIAGLMLAFVQIIYVMLLFRISDWTEKWSENEGVENRQFGLFLSLVVFFLAWMHIIHWSISWGNVLGLFPVMGQPMSWISSANSHMLFVGFPTIVFTLVSYIQIKFN